MKCIIIGLGNFGSSLGKKLTELGHEVLGVDNIMAQVETFKEDFTHTICLDSTDPQAVDSLPLQDTDVVIICIGEDEGANIMATAVMKQKKVKRLISRSLGPLHTTVLEAMGVDEIAYPEEETANRWAKKLNISGIIDSFEITKDYNIVEAEVPQSLNGKSLRELDLAQEYNVLVLTKIILEKKKKSDGKDTEIKNVQGVASADMSLYEGEIMVLYGKIQDIEKLLKEWE